MRVKVTVRDAPRRKHEKKFTVTGPGKTLLVKKAFRYSRARTSWLTWSDDVGGVIDELYRAGQEVANEYQEEVHLDVDCRFGESFNPDEPED